MLGRGRGCGPFEGGATPGVRARRPAAEVAPGGIGDEQHAARDRDRRADRGDHVERAPAHALAIGIDAARHALETQDVHREEAEVEAADDQPEADLAQGFRHHPPGRLGIPIGEGAEEREHRAADQHIVEMGDHEIGVGHLLVERGGGGHHARQAADHEGDDEGKHPQERRVEAGPAGCQRRDPAEDLDAGRERHRHAGGGVEVVAEPRQPDREHVVDPETKGERGDGEHRQHHRGMAEEGAAGEGLDDHRHEAGGRQEDDVDLRMAEPPEEVLEQHRIAAGRGREELGGDEAVCDQHAGDHHHRRERKDRHERGEEHRPDEQRDARERHAGRAHLEHGGGDVDRGGERRDLGKGDHLRPDVGAVAGRIGGAGERRIFEPAEIGRDAEGVRHPQHQHAAEIQPVAERREPRKGERALAEHQRHQPDRHRLHHRHRHQEQHGRAVEREALVVELRRHPLHVGHGELEPHVEREHAGEEQQQHHRQDVARGDPLVIDRGQEAPDAGRVGPGDVQRAEFDGGGARIAHFRSIR